MNIKDTTYKARFEALRSLAFGSVVGTYTAVGSALTDEAEISVIYNGTDVGLLLSFDGETDHCFLPAYSQRVIDWDTNGKVIGNHTTFYVKHNGTAPSSGSIYVEVVI